MLMSIDLLGVRNPPSATIFLSGHGVINNHFRQQRHLLKARHYRLLRDRAFDQWAQITCAQNFKIA